MSLKTRFKNLSIRMKFTLTSSAMLLFVSVFLAVLSSYTLWKDNTGRVREDYDAVMEQSVNSIENIFSNVSSLARIIAPNQWIQEYYHETNSAYKTVEQKALIQSFLNTIIEPHNTIFSINIYGLDNRIVSASLNQQNTIPKAIDQAAFDEQVSLLQTNWGTTIYLPPQHSVYSSKNQPQNFISVLKPIISTASGNLVAVLDIAILESTFSGSIASMYSSDEADVFITDASGAVISSPDADKIGTSITGSELYHSLENNWGTDSLNQFIREDGKQYLICMRKFSSLDWYMVAKIPASVLYSQSKQQLAVILMITCIALFISIPVSFRLAGTISRPVQSLCECMDQAAAGNLNVTIPSFGEDEIGYLSHKFTHMLAQISALIAQVTQEKLARRESQLLALQAQINPHFLYNTLESISALISLKLYEDAVRMTHSLEIFYKTALSGGKNVIPLEKEIQNVNTYLEILKYRYRTMFDYTISLPPELSHYVIAKLTIQPLVENAIYHGIRKQEKTGLLAIDCRLEQDTIVISVTDNGPGFGTNYSDPIPDTPTSHYGLQNVNERIQLYFGKPYGLSIDTTYTRGARVLIRIPAVTASTETTIQLQKQGGTHDSNTDRR